MKKNITILIYILSFLLLISCSKIHRHAEKSSIPEKEPRKERVYFTYGLKSKKGSESGDEYIVQKGDTLYSISLIYDCLLYTSPSPRDRTRSRMPSSA